MALTAGARLGPDQILCAIGAGGMGEVYRARDTRLKRDVAIKILPEALASDPQFRERFDREARALSQLDHPHICSLFDVGEQNGTAYLVMQYLEGETLADRLKRSALPLKDALTVAIQIADALDTAHHAAIVHRDLKPGNIVLTKSGAKLLDFGLAKVMDAPADVTRTVDGTVLGTVAYMSPEQAEGKALDSRSDVFSFGAVLYEMIAGRRAFRGDTVASVLAAVLRDEPAELQAPRALVRIVERCLAKPPAQRFRAMSELKSALQQVTEAAVEEGPSIAVLPFANMSSDPENEYFGDGIAEEIINALTHIDGLHVAARTSSFSFKGKSVEVGDIAKRLKVRHVLEGSVRKAGNRVRVTAQLVDASNGYQLWSERYDRELADIFDVQDEIAREIVGRLKVALAGGGSARLVKVTTINMEAYQQYLKGRAMLYRRGPWIVPALESFQKAVDLDPGYAQAWAGLADARTILGYSGHCRPEETMPAALDAATRAVAADAASAEAHSALAGAALLWERDFEKAEREFRQALALNPQYVQARVWFGHFFLQLSVRRREDGLMQLWRALEADPLSSYASAALSMGLEQVGQREEAVRRARIAVDQDPESFISRLQLGNACQWNGQYADALAAYEPLWTRSVHPWLAMEMVPTYAKTGRDQEARSIYQALLERRSREYVPSYLLSVCASALGDHEAAIGFCEEAVKNRDVMFGLFHQWSPNFERVRTDPRFADILARFNARGRALA